MTNRSIPRERRPELQKALELLAEWLNYDDSTKQFVPHLLNSEYIRPFFREYRRDCLEPQKSGPAAIIDGVGCEQLFGWVRENNAFKQPKYYANSSSSSSGSGGISKKGWTVLDHAARFVVRVLRFSWENDGEWSHGRFDPDGDEDGESDLEFYQVWVVLCYLQAEWEAANLGIWGILNLPDVLR